MPDNSVKQVPLPHTAVGDGNRICVNDMLGRVIKRMVCLIEAYKSKMNQYLRQKEDD